MSVSLINFFVLEASDYVDRLGRIAASDEPQGPDSATLLKLARGLRGSAVMARLSSFADAASTLERGARLLHEGRIAWTSALARAMRDAIAELHALTPLARHWDESHDQRARSADTRLAAVLDAAERHGSAMQSGAAAPPQAVPTTTKTEFFNSIDQHFTAEAAPAPAAAPRPTDAPQAPTPLPAGPRPGLPALSDALMPIVPIATLASDNDPNPVVFRAPNPTITFTQRFYSDVSPLIGSLRARLAPLRQGAMQHAGADMLAAFRPVLVSLRDIAASYEHEDIAAFCDGVLSAPAPLPAAAAGALDTALTVMLQQDLAPHVREQRLAELRRVVVAATPLSTSAQSQPAARTIGAIAARGQTPMRATIIPTPTAPPPTVARPTPAAPSGRELNSLLNASLDRVRELDRTPLDLIAVPANGATAPPAPDGEPDIVPIDDLLYRGPRALSRARHIVGQLRSTGPTADPTLMQELFDLVELAGTPA
jgi:chemotaxis protein histidine kinase CheA